MNGGSVIVKIEPQVIYNELEVTASANTLLSSHKEMLKELINQKKVRPLELDSLEKIFDVKAKINKIKFSRE